MRYTIHSTADSGKGYPDGGKILSYYVIVAKAVARSRNERVFYVGRARPIHRGSCTICGKNSLFVQDNMSYKPCAQFAETLSRIAKIALLLRNNGEVSRGALPRVIGPKIVGWEEHVILEGERRGAPLTIIQLRILPLSKPFGILPWWGRT